MPILQHHFNFNVLIILLVHSFYDHFFTSVFAFLFPPFVLLSTPSLPPRCYFSPESRLGTLSNNLVTRNLTNSDINNRKNALQKDKENTHVINSRRYIQYLFTKVRKTYKLHPEKTFIDKTNQSFKFTNLSKRKNWSRRPKGKNYHLKNRRETVVAQINGRNSQRWRIDFFG